MAAFEKFPSPLSRPECIQGVPPIFTQETSFQLQ